MGMTGDRSRRSTPDSTEHFPVLSTAERDRRWARVRDLMDDHELDGVLAFSTTRDRADAYLAKEASMGGTVFLPREGHPTLISPAPAALLSRRDAQGLIQERWIEDLRAGPPPRVIADLVSGIGAAHGRIGVVDRSRAMPGATGVSDVLWRGIVEASPGVTWQNISVPFEWMRLVKSEEEQSLFRHAASIGESACRAFLDAARPGARESDVVAAIEAEIAKRGGHSMAPGMILRSGRRPHGGFIEWGWAGGEPPVLKEGDAIGAELFSCYAGFETQQQMHVQFGFDGEHERLAVAARAAYEAGVGALRPGVRFSAVCAAMREPIVDARAWSRAPVLQTVSPVVVNAAMWVGAAGRPDLEGLDVPAEVPADDDFAIVPGMTFALEPSAVVGLHQVCVGGTVIVTEDGCEELNDLATRSHTVEC